ASQRFAQSRRAKIDDSDRRNGAAPAVMGRGRWEKKTNRAGTKATLSRGRAVQQNDGRPRERASSRMGLLSPRVKRIRAWLPCGLSLLELSHDFPHAHRVLWPRRIHDPRVLVEQLLHRLFGVVLLHALRSNERSLLEWRTKASLSTLLEATKRGERMGI